MSKRLGYQLKRAQHALRTAMDSSLRELGITAPQYAALSALSLGPLSGAELARRCFVTPQTMNAVLMNLEDAHHVQRQPHAVHGRVLEARLTPAGGKLLRRAHRVVEQIEARMVDGVSSAEQARLTDAVRRCADSLSSGTAANST